MFGGRKGREGPFPFFTGLQRGGEGGKKERARVSFSPSVMAAEVPAGAARQEKEQRKRRGSTHLYYARLPTAWEEKGKKGGGKRKGRTGVPFFSFHRASIKGKGGEKKTGVDLLFPPELVYGRKKENEETLLFLLGTPALSIPRRRKGEERKKEVLFFFFS